MIANVVHTSLNARGGGEKLAVATIHALSSMGFKVELVTGEKPNEIMIRDAYGMSIEHAVKKVRTLSLFFNHIGKGITVNTHGDMLPFFRRNFNKKNSIVYCHYPIAGHLIDCGDSDYATVLQNMCLSTLSEKYRNTYFKAAKDAYRNMMTNSTVLTNSEFSRKAIFKTFGVDSQVLHPPVDTDAFRRVALSSGDRDDSILVVSRFHPSKKIENAIQLARLLKKNHLGSHMTIAGNMSPAGIGYYIQLRHLAKRYGLDKFVKFEVNTRFERLLYLMQSAKVYFHPLPGEPFGISTVEAMSAGLIPVVPDIGGHTEFVPAKYHFHTFGQGVEAVATALEASASERIQMSRSTEKFSTTNYIKNFQQVITQVTDIDPIASTPVIAISKRHPESKVV